MNVGRLITNDGIEYSLDSSQFEEFIEYLRRREEGEVFAPELSELAGVSGVVDPEDYERVAQATYFTRRKGAFPAAA
jgi:hypothetical protein